MKDMMRKRARTTGLICAAALATFAVGSCTRPGTGAVGGTSYVAQVQAQGTAHWTCTSHGLGGHMVADHGADSGYANDYYKGKTKGTLSLADCMKNAQTFDKVLKYALKYPTRSSAASFPEAVQFVKGLGTHNMTGSMGSPPGNPFFLQYDGDTPTAPLAGMSWFTYAGAAPPPGFAGDNDFWHSHTSLCYTSKANIKDVQPGAPGIGVAANEISDAECQAKGGVNLKLPGIWMSHAWIVPGYEDKFDIFAGASACVQGTGKPSANDPCHTIDMADPEHAGNGGEHNMPGMTTTTARPGTPTTRPAVTTRPVVTTRPAVTTTTMMPGMDHSH